MKSILALLLFSSLASASVRRRSNDLVYWRASPTSGWQELGPAEVITFRDDYWDLVLERARLETKLANLEADNEVLKTRVNYFAEQADYWRDNANDSLAWWIGTTVVAVTLLLYMAAVSTASMLLERKRLKALRAYAGEYKARQQTALRSEIYR